MTEEKQEILKAIETKYRAQGEDEMLYLKGLQHAKPINYWEYIQLDTLLSLQHPRTDFADEKVFILYHQVTELVLSMIQHELDQMNFADVSKVDSSYFEEKISRCIRYIEMLTKSFEVMRHGMSLEEYNKFRHTLTPASGYQSVTFRLIEISFTPLENLIHPMYKGKIDPNKFSNEELIGYLYWQSAGKNFDTGKKTLLLQTFEDKYLDKLVAHIEKMKNNNLYSRLQNLFDIKKNEKLTAKLRELDDWYNVRWPLVHYETANSYLSTGKQTTKATGGSDWKKYLHPKYQKRVFFPEIWTDRELENWGE